MTTVADQVHDFIGRQRWFGGKGRAFTVGDLQLLGFGLHVVEVRFEDGTELYQLPLSSYDAPQPSLAHALVGEWAGTWHYDAVHDPEAGRAWLAAVDAASSDGEVRACRASDQPIDPDLDPRVFSGEQSNSSIAFGQTAMLKLFRRVTPGTNPDIEIHAALTRAGNRHVAQLLGWLEAGDLQLGLLQQFLIGAEDGWQLALDSARGHHDFTDESRRIGIAVAQVHEALRHELPVTTIPGRRVAAHMATRLDEALAVAPQLAEHAAGLTDLYELITETAVPAQRIHADLHLGQTLRTADGWKLVDFEGEPARPLAERTLPDSVWRDIAGMLRSFDYAARVVEREGADPGDWTTRNRAAFLAGHAFVSGDPIASDLTLIRAFEADKAVYEVNYETRNRPDWADIPLQAIARILEQS